MGPLAALTAMLLVAVWAMPVLLPIRADSRHPLHQWQQQGPTRAQRFGLAWQPDAHEWKCAGYQPKIRPCLRESDYSLFCFEGGVDLQALTPNDFFDP